MLAKSNIFMADTDKQNSSVYERYAVYFTPNTATRLHEFGSSWLGYDLEHGDIEPTTYGLPTDLVEEMTRAPRRYGFHATLKAPFYLAENTSAKDLVQRVKSIAENRSAFTIGPLTPTWFGDLLVLTQRDASHTINQFASQCVLGFEDFRAPLTMKERTRRLELNLNMHQRLMLEELGYPYVLSEFRFHLTVTSKLTQQQKDAALPTLMPVLEKVCSEPCHIDGLSLVGDPGNGQPFELIERFELKR